MAVAFEIAGLTKDYPTGLRRTKLRAVDNLSLRVESGQVYGFLGPNGSGKSTTLKLLLGILQPTAGACRIFDRPAGELRARALCGYLPEAPYFYRHLTGLELVAFYARICGVPRSGRVARSRETLALVGLDQARDRRVGTYSKGMLQRLGIAQALVHDPQLVVLDEPTAGVDPIGSAEIGQLIRELKRRGKTVLLCSHLLSQVEELCDRAAILHRGRLVAEGTLDELLVSPEEETVTVSPPLTGVAAAELERWLTGQGSRLVARSALRRRLERFFVETIEGDLPDRRGVA